MVEKRRGEEAAIAGFASLVLLLFVIHSPNYEGSRWNIAEAAARSAAVSVCAGPS